MKKPCPNCKIGIAICDTVDNGVGEQQCGPYSCEACGWIEPMPQFEFDESDKIEF